MPSWAKWAVSFIVAAGLIALGWRVSAVLVSLHILVCFVLVIVIMLQSGNAADLAGAFGGAGSQTAFGPRGAATFLSRATTWCAIVFMATSLALSLKRTPAEISTGSILEQTNQPASSPAKSTPAIPSQPIQLPIQPNSPAPSSNPAQPAQLPAQPSQAPAPAPAQPAPAPAPAQNPATH